MENDKPFDEATDCTGGRIRAALLRLPHNVKKNAQEIRLRCNRSLLVRLPDRDVTFLPNGQTSNLPMQSKLCVTREELEECFRIVCGYSVHTHQQQLCSGFVTVKGGHRVGVAGTAVCTDGSITAIRDISSINIRIAREHKGCAAELFGIIRRGGFRSFLLAGPPCTGKTTLLRDLARLLSAVEGKNTVVLDERGELAACVSGAPQYDLGASCDVLTGYPKSEAVDIALRCLSPDFIVTDEVNSLREAQAIESGFHSGVSFFLSVHAHTPDELRQREPSARLLSGGMFGGAAFLNNRSDPGKLQWMQTAGEWFDTDSGRRFDLSGGRAGWSAGDETAKNADHPAFSVC